jgi:hypothetical protein
MTAFRFGETVTGNWVTGDEKMCYVSCVTWKKKAVVGIKKPMPNRAGLQAGTTTIVRKAVDAYNVEVLKR